MVCCGEKVQCFRRVAREVILDDLRGKLRHERDVHAKHISQGERLTGHILKSVFIGLQLRRPGQERLDPLTDLALRIAPAVLVNVGDDVGVSLSVCLRQAEGSLHPVSIRFNVHTGEYSVRDELPDTRGRDRAAKELRQTTNERPGEPGATASARGLNGDYTNMNACADRSVDYN